MAENLVRIIMKRRLRDEHGQPVKVQPISEFLPEFPPSLLRSGIEGAAEIAFNVLDDGSVTDVRVVSAMPPEFGTAATETIARTKFHPLRETGLAAPVSVRCHLSFKT
jgi:TonB family protein